MIFYTAMNDSARALDVWQELKNTPKFFSQTAFAHLIKVCAASGHLEQVEDIYKTAIDSGHVLHETTLGTTMMRLYAST